ncbi:MAG: hypothetical protein V3U20_08115 [Thermoplasmata archaeon]
MTLCRTCEFSRSLGDGGQSDGMEYECYVDLQILRSNRVVGIKKCSMYKKLNTRVEVMIAKYQELPEINPTSLTICANLQTYIQDLAIEDRLNNSSLKWIDMMCNQGKALKEFTKTGKVYQYVIGIEPCDGRETEFEYHRIYSGDPATIDVRPKPNLITSRYGFYYADLESKKRFLKLWHRLLEKNGIIVIYPYFTKTSHDIESLDSFIDEQFRNVERSEVKNGLIRLIITK